MHRLLGAYTEDSRIWEKLFSSRIDWVSGQAARAEVTCVTFFPFSQAQPPLSLKTKTHKSAPGKYDFFFTLHKAVKKPRIASFAFNLQKLSHDSSPAQNLVANQLYFLPQETVDLLLEKMAWTSDGAFRRTRDSSFCNDDLHVRAEWEKGVKNTELYFKFPCGTVCVC